MSKPMSRSIFYPALLALFFTISVLIAWALMSSRRITPDADAICSEALRHITATDGPRMSCM